MVETIAEQVRERVCDGDSLQVMQKVVVNSKERPADKRRSTSF
jgi:hypothetical protein